PHRLLDQFAFQPLIEGDEAAEHSAVVLAVDCNDTFPLAAGMIAFAAISLLAPGRVSGRRRNVHTALRRRRRRRGRYHYSFKRFDGHISPAYLCIFNISEAVDSINSTIACRMAGSVIFAIAVAILTLSRVAMKR